MFRVSRGTTCRVAPCECLGSPTVLCSIKLSATPQVFSICFPRTRLQATSQSSSQLRQRHQRNHCHMHLQGILGLVGGSISPVTTLACPSITSSTLKTTELSLPIEARESRLSCCQADKWGQSSQWANADNDGRGKCLIGVVYREAYILVHSSSTYTTPRLTLLRT